MATTYLTRTFGSAGNQKTWTWSAWIKRSQLGAAQVFFANYTDSNNREYLSFNSSDQIYIYAAVGGTDKIECNTTSLFRDVNAWYHIVVAQDTTQGTGSNRMKVYVNGVQQTLSFSTTPSQNDDLGISDNGLHLIGAESAGQTEFSGLMSHVHFSDGYALAPTVFGSTDSTTGEWEINTSPSFTLGTNGFTVLKDGNTITDQSSNSNDFALGAGTLTKTEDCPSNVFATFNPLDNYYPAMTLSYGNTRALTIGGKYTYTPTTLGMTSGKYYAEIKCTAQSGSQNEFLVGITSTSTSATTHELGHNTNDYGYNAPTGNSRTGDTASSYGATFTTGDIIGIAVDLDNNKLYFHKNGTYQNSGDPTSGSTGTGALSITDPASTARGAYFFAVSYFSSTDTGTYDANFGNGYFGTTQVSSAGTNASNNGIFEYNVPAGYTALSTKGLNL